MNKTNRVETVKDRRANKSTDPTDFVCSKISDAEVLTSIDQIFRCSQDWGIFADVAISHAVADVLVGGATPSLISISFAFGPDVEIDLTEEARRTERQTATLAFHESAMRKGLVVGKCHSVFTNDPTNVTISTLGVRQTPMTSIPRKGSIHLGGKIGDAKELYMSEIGLTKLRNDCLQRLRTVSQPIATSYNSLHTDISGHGLAGAALLACLQNGWDARLFVGSDCVVTAETVGYPISCLQNSLVSYGLNLTCDSPNAEAICTLRETSGPMLSFVECGDIELNGFPCIGHFVKGSGKVSVSWQN